MALVSFFSQLYVPFNIETPKDTYFVKPIPFKLCSVEQLSRERERFKLDYCIIQLSDISFSCTELELFHLRQSTVDHYIYLYWGNKQEETVTEVTVRNYE